MSRVAVLMSTFNGEKYVEKQVESIIKQQDVCVELYVRDDGSTDSTREILKTLSMENKNIHMTFGNNLYYPKSFLSLCKDVSGFDFYAFSDQDDYWEEDKLIRAIKLIDSNHSKYSLYVSALLVVDDNLCVIGKKEFRGLRTSLGSEMSRHRLAGCTMVWSGDLHDEFVKYVDTIMNGSPIPTCESHDGWLTLFCILINGKVIYDSEPHILYRRHNSALTNTKGGFKKRLSYEIKRFVNREDYRKRLSGFILDNFSELIDNDSRKLLKEIYGYRDNGFSKKLELMLSGKVDTGMPIIDLMSKAAILLSVF